MSTLNNKNNKITSKSSAAKFFAGLGLSVAAALAGGFLTIPFEGSVKNKNGEHTVYRDPVGVITACYGQTGKDLYGRPIKLGMKYSEEECLTMLSKTLTSFEKELDSVVRVPYKSEYMKASLIDFTYNVGIYNVKSSTLLKKLNHKEYSATCDELTKWVYAKKQKLKGLVVRRAEEWNWCMGGVDYEVIITQREIAKIVADTISKKE